MADERKPKRRDYQWFPDGFWSPPKRQNAPLQGDRRKERIYLAVGCALSEWERTESVLVGLYHIFCRTDRAPQPMRLAVERTYGAIESTTGRLSVLEAAAEAYFGKYWNDQRVRYPFDALVESFRHAAYRRNEIAHGIVIVPSSVTGNTGGSHTTRRYGAFLVAASYSTRHNSLPRDKITDHPLSIIDSQYAYMAVDLLGFSAKFKRLGDRAIIFRGDVVRHNGEPPRLIKDAIAAESARTAQKKPS